MKQGQYFEFVTATSLKDIRKALQNDGECIFGDIEITLDNMDNCEVVKDGVLLFSCSEWWELEEYLEDMIWNSSHRIIAESARAKAMRKCFSAKELDTIRWALERLADYHEEKSNIQNATGINTKYKENHKNEAQEIRKLAINFYV